MAQNKIWDKTIGGDGYESKPSIYPTPDGGYILGSSSSSDKSKDKSESSGVDDFWIVKLKSDGSIAWENTLNVHDWERLVSVLPTPDGGYIAGGYTAARANGDKTAPKKGKNDYWIVKLKADGTFAWDKSFGGPGNDLLRTMQVTTDGGYILGGYSDSGISKDKSDPRKGSWIIKLKADGAKEWDKTLVGGGATAFGLTHDQILQTQDGGYLLGTTSNYGKVGDKTGSSRGSSDYWIVKLNADGTKAWDKTFGGTQSDYLATVIQTQDGGYFLAGNSKSGMGADKSDASRDVGNGSEFFRPIDYWVIKVDVQGNKIWDKTIGGDLYDAVSSAQQTSDGGYLLGGSSTSTISGEKTQRNEGSTDYWVVKLKVDGSKDWDEVVGGNSEDRLWTALQTKDQSYILAGESFSGISADKSEKNLGFSDLWVVKLDNKITNKKEQTITFNQLSDKDLQSQKIFTLGGISTSGLPVSYRVQDGPATVKGNQVTLSGLGTVTIVASQAGNNSYEAAREIKQTFTVINSPVVQLWNKLYGGVATKEIPANEECPTIFGKSAITAMIATPDGGYLLGGTSDSKKGNDKSQDHMGTASPEICYAEEQPIADYWVVKIDTNGKKLWDKTIGTNKRDQLVAMVPTQDGGYLLGGNSGDFSFYEPYSDYYLVKIDANGNMLWDKTISLRQADFMTGLIATPDGGFLISDYDQYRNYDYTLLKIDAQGKQLWKKNYDYTSGWYGDKLTTLATADGGYLVGGTFFSNGDNGNGRDAYNYKVSKLDATGKEIWKKVYGGNGFDALYSLLATPNGGYLLGGYSESGLSGDKSEGSQGGSDYWVIQVDANGNKQWDTSFGGDKNESVTTMVSTPDGGYLLGGQSKSLATGDKSEAIQSYWLVKIDSKGKKIWDKTFGTPMPYGRFQSLLVDSQGNYLLGGESGFSIAGDQEQAPKGLIDYWVIKIKEKSLLKSTSSHLPYLVKENKPKLAPLLAYPNPFQDILTIRFTLPETQTATLRILDGQGKAVATLFQQEAQAQQLYEVEWQASKQEAGMYFLQLQTPTGQSTQKLFLSK
ncbi:T9SS type A sorting domain-containing protein [Adhaeribacter swui]|uniref:T9SS type A sorting domain-containing protein n=1 Tax=Adhaeribacter swui TaxID=2086471 RepID=A0A7G7G4P8_9BACT|nr:T9SS type A sorting domain-containing protein [Adhaeribacter swui]QNF32132.1 T9SS type A sorting domain-containing protein [Adhaeribacter swui]